MFFVGRFKIVFEEFNCYLFVVFVGNFGICNVVFIVVNIVSVLKILFGVGDVGLSFSVFLVNVMVLGIVVVNLFIKGI